MRCKIGAATAGLRKNRGRAGLGRPRGSKNHATASIRALAAPYSEQALAVITELLQSKTEAIRLAAANALLDRAHGKPPQALTGEEGIGPVTVTVTHHYEP